MADKASELERIIRESMPLGFKARVSDNPSAQYQGPASDAYGRAVRYVNELIASGKKELDFDDLRKLNDIVEGSEAGGIRGIDNLDKVRSETGYNYPIPYKVPQLLATWYDWNRAVREAGMDVATMAKGSRELLMTIHPFPNGNGRVGKLIEQFFLKVA